jgi:predicted DNA-binding transcriptional regulator AlpA
MDYPKNWVVPVPGRGLTAKEAAEFCGVAEPTFRKYVHEGKYPRPTLPGKRWDRRLLDKWMDEKSGLTDESSNTSDHDADNDENNPWDVVLSDAKDKKRTT